MRIAIIAVVAACGATGPGEDHGGIDGGVRVDGATVEPPLRIDDDGDGLEDALETQLARDYLPFISIDDRDGCPRSGLVARVRPHPDDATKILIVYSHLYERDCGFNGHVGDNEAFGIAVDPTRPAPDGILAIRTASHQATVCERVTECSTCPGDDRPACDEAPDAGAMWPVLYASRGKHGQYATLGQCPLIGTCLDVCSLASTRTRPPVVNVGEPAAPLVRDLTAAGFITPANGWTEAALMNADPWDATTDFGSAGNIAGDLTDVTFTPALCD